MLSKHSTKLLRWLAKQDRWLTKAEMQNECKYFDDRSFRAIHEEKYLLLRRAGDRAQLIQYRISDLGDAYLEGIKYARMADVREWLSFGLSVAAIVISIIALLTQSGIL